MSETDWLLEQWRELRGGISGAQNARMVALGFTVAFLGSAMDKLSGPAGTGVAGMCLVVVALTTGLSVHLTQGIDYAAGYVRRYIEPRVDDLKWETRIQRNRVKTARLRVLAGGFSKSLALALVLLVAGVDLMWWWAAPARSAGEFIVVGALSLLCFTAASDLYLRWSSGWHTDWSAVPDPDLVLPPGNSPQQPRQKAGDQGEHRI
jgi:hypothetical protein